MDKLGRFATTGRKLGRRLRKPVLTLLATALTLMLADAQQAIIPEIQVTTAPIPDYEFDSARNGVFCQACNNGKGNSRLVFAAADNTLWVGYVDFQTGDFVPPDGRGELVDTNAAAATDYGNGPEWTDSSSGSSFSYTQYTPGLPHSDETACVAVATQDPTGAWVTNQLSNGCGRASPAGTLDPNDPDPRFNYVTSVKGAWYWRKNSQPDVENVLPLSQLTDGNARRWVRGTHKIFFQGHPPDDPSVLRDQVYTYDTDSGVLEQLTSNPQGVLGGMMWQAPEFRNEFVFFTMAKFRQQILVYRKVPGADRLMRWTIVKTITAPPTLPFIWSPEVFVHNGRSYIFFQVSSSSKFFDLSIPNQIAISGADPLRPDFRLVTNDAGTPRVRLDPEYFITAQGPFIYYNRLVPETETHGPINDGVWRVDLGLGPPR
jgi:hypothetical protein